jgi:dihydropteroate synthase
MVPDEITFIDPGFGFGTNAFHDLRQVLRWHHLHHYMHMVIGAVHR